jgi:hypothetical protein
MPPDDLNRTAYRGRNLQSLRTVMRRGDIKSAATVSRRVDQGILPQPVIVNGVRFWFEDEVDAALASLPRGQGTKPVIALAARARRIEERKAAAKGIGHNGRPFVGPTRRGFVRRAP